MTAPMIALDETTGYEVKEVAIIVAALAFVIAVGGIALAAVIICGWKGAQGVTMDWVHGKATFACKN